MLVNLAKFFYITVKTLKGKTLVKIVFGILIFLFIVALCVLCLKMAWRKMHEIAGIEVGTSPLSLPQTTANIGYQPSTPLPNNIAKQFERLTADNQQMITTKHGKISPMPLLVGLNVDKINLMPTEAVVILDRIHDKLSRYQAWQQESEATSEEVAWLTEKKFVLDRLINQTIPEAINHYDQLARFNPYQLTQKIHHDMTASDILIEVLLGVDKQIDELLHELNQQVSQKLATTYHYVKTRVIH